VPREPQSVSPAPASAPAVQPADVIGPVMSAVAEATSALARVIPVPKPVLTATHAAPAAPVTRARGSVPARVTREPTVNVNAIPLEVAHSLPPTSAVLAAGATAPPQAEPVGGRVERSRTPDKPAAGAFSLPQRLPPQSPLPQPDAGAPGAGGGGGSSPLLLLFGALTAGFALFGFRFHPRRLPRTAFLKPRRVVLAVWHPG
jgi:hypothetical protein